VKTLFLSTLLFATSSLFAQSAGLSASSDCDCETFTSEEHCALILCQSMEGTIKNEGSPVGCACVKIFQGPKLMYASKTNADGAYNIPNVTMGIYTVEVTKGDAVYKINNVKMNHEGPTVVSADLKDLPAVSEFESSK
jgi:hypothetical protein